MGNQFKQFGAWHIGGRQLNFASLARAVHSESILCQIDVNGYDSDQFPPSGELIKTSQLPSLHWIAVNRNSHNARLAWTREVSFIRRHHKT